MMIKQMTDAVLVSFVWLVFIYQLALEITSFLLTLRVLKFSDILVMFNVTKLKKSLKVQRFLKCINIH